MSLVSDIPCQCLVPFSLSSPSSLACSGFSADLQTSDSQLELSNVSPWHSPFEEEPVSPPNSLPLELLNSLGGIRQCLCRDGHALDSTHSDSPSLRLLQKEDSSHRPGRESDLNPCGSPRLSENVLRQNVSGRFGSPVWPVHVSVEESTDGTTHVYDCSHVFFSEASSLLGSDRVPSTTRLRPTFPDETPSPMEPLPPPFVAPRSHITGECKKNETPSIASNRTKTFRNERNLGPLDVTIGLGIGLPPNPPQAFRSSRAITLLQVSTTSPSSAVYSLDVRQSIRVCSSPRPGDVPQTNLHPTILAHSTYNIVPSSFSPNMATSPKNPISKHLACAGSPPAQTLRVAREGRERRRSSISTLPFGISSLDHQRGRAAGKQPQLPSKSLHAREKAPLSPSERNQDGGLQEMMPCPIRGLLPSTPYENNENTIAIMTVSPRRNEKRMWMQPTAIPDTPSLKQLPFSPRSFQYSPQVSMAEPCHTAYRTGLGLSIGRTKQVTAGAPVLNDRMLLDKVTYDPYFTAAIMSP